jgi:phosphatidylserine decarboxylase
VLPQYVLPQLLLSTLMHRFARLRWRPLRSLQIRWFLRRYAVDLTEAQETDPGAYPHLNSLFTRALRPGARPLPATGSSLVVPADGVISAIGQAHGDSLIQAKGQTYTVGDLLGDDFAAAPFLGGSYFTVYLSPRDYHRVHMPAAGRLLAMRYVPGRLFSVNAATSLRVPRLFARNERVIARFETPVGEMAVVLVGAFFVGGIETVWAGPITPPHGQPPLRRSYAAEGETIHLARGEEMGRFNMGSTVIVLFEPGRVEWEAEMTTGTRVKMGQAIGHPCDPSGAPRAG